MLLRRLISRRQHTLGTDAVPAGRIVNQHMGYRSNKPSILENRAAAHSLNDTPGCLQQTLIGDGDR